MQVVALSGGVGGAKLVRGLSRLPGISLTVIVNTGDDFTHWGLRISPDLDTVMYTLAGIADPRQGWGVERDTFEALAMVSRLGGDGWFRIGDRDLGVNLMRTEALARGEPLTAITGAMCRALAVGATVLPMADEPRATMVDTVGHGILPFQTYFVRHRFEPVIRGIRFLGATTPSEGVMSALAAAQVILIGPSNPYVSIDPIITLRGVKDAMRRRPVVAVSPIVAGRAVKGPLDKMMRELGHERASSEVVASHYGGIIDGIVVEQGDERELLHIPDLRVLATRTLMSSLDDQVRLASEVMALAREIIRDRPA